MENVIKQLNEEEIKLACKIANNITNVRDAGIYVEPHNLDGICAPALKQQIKDDIGSLTAKAQMVANEILMKIKWEYHDEDQNLDNLRRRNKNVKLALKEFEIHTKVGGIYCNLVQVDYGVLTGLFKLITICGHDFQNGRDIILGEFEDLLDKEHSRVIWFDPNITHAINNN